MYDMTFYIPDNDDPEFSDLPTCPDDEIPDHERERLDNELYQLIDQGAFDPDLELHI